MKYIFILFAILVHDAFAATVSIPLSQPCTVAAISQVSIAGDHKSLSVVCDAVAVTPPPDTTSTVCTEGSAGDIPGYKRHCAGQYVLHSGEGQDITETTHQYTWDFLFRSPWPGSGQGNSSTVELNKSQFVSVPFKPSPGHTIHIDNNDTYADGVQYYSVSTVPGIFAKGDPRVVCSATDNPALRISSNGSTTAQCKLDPNKTYFFNFVSAKLSTTGAGWYSNCGKAFCKSSLTWYITN